MCKFHESIGTTFNVSMSPSNNRTPPFVFVVSIFAHVQFSLTSWQRLGNSSNVKEPRWQSAGTSSSWVVQDSGFTEIGACVNCELRAHDDPLREVLKQKYGCFAGNEQSKWPAVTRRSGIPSLVVIGSDGSEVEFNAMQLVERKGPPILKKWPVW